MALASGGAGLFVIDSVLDAIFSLRYLPSGDFDMYGNSTRRVGWGYNDTQIYCDPSDSVIVYNNALKKPIIRDLEYYAMKLAAIDRTIDVNVNAQKTPVLILCDENERLSMENLYKQYDGNYPVIFGNKRLSPEAIKAISTNAPYVSDKLNELKNKVWNEALTYLGVYNVEYKSGNITIEEVQRSQGGVIASRFGSLLMRQKACDELNAMTGLDVWCEYRDPSDYVQFEGPMRPDRDVGIAEVSETERRTSL